MADRYWRGGAGTWNSTNTTNWSATSGGAGGASVPTSADDVYFDALSSAVGYTVTTAAGMVCRSLNLAPPASGSATFSNTNNTVQIFGSLTHAASGIVWGASVSFTFASTTTGNAITTNGFSFNNIWTFNGVGGEWTLQDNVTTASNRSLVLTNGSLNLNDKTFTCGFFNSNVNNTRGLHFGTGKIVCTFNNGSIVSMAATNLTVSGSRRVEFSYTGAVGTRTVGLTSIANSTNALDFYILGGTDIVSTTGSARSARNLDFTGFKGTYTIGTTGNVTVFGNLTLDPGMTLTAASVGFTFAAPSGTQTVTTNGKTLDIPVTVATTGATVAFADALTVGATKTLTLTSTAVKFLAGSTNTAGTFAIAGSPSVTLQSSVPGTQFTLSQASGTVSASNMTVSDSIATGGATWNAFVDQNNVDGGNNIGWDFFAQLGKYIYTRRKNKRILL